jgi:hypothetical protein
MSDSSDDEVFESKISPPAETKVKAKRQLTKAQLSQLALAREKANAVRKQNALHRKTQKDKEQQLKEMRRQQEIDVLDEELEQYQRPKKKTKAKAPPREEPEPEPESESSESEEEPEEVKPRKKSKKVKRVKKAPVSSSESSSDEEYIAVKKTRKAPVSDMYDHQMRRAFASLFPNSFV